MATAEGVAPVEDAVPGVPCAPGVAVWSSLRAQPPSKTTSSNTDRIGVIRLIPLTIPAQTPDLLVAPLYHKLGTEDKITMPGFDKSGSLW
jgi:hypothetical protein